MKTENVIDTGMPITCTNNSDNIIEINSSDYSDNIIEVGPSDNLNDTK